MENNSADSLTAQKTDLTYLFRILGIAIVVFITGRLGLMIPYFNSNITLFWLPTGIGVAAVTWFGPWAAVGMFLGSFAINFSHPTPVLVACGIATGTTSAVLLSRFILMRASFRKSLDRVRDVLALAAAAAIGMFLSATIGVGSLYFGAILPSSALVDAWRVWWMGDALGVVLAAPFLLTISRQNLSLAMEKRWELVGILGIALIVGTRSGIFSTDLIFIPATFLILSWCVLRFGQFATFALLIVISGFSALTSSRIPYESGNVDGIFALWVHISALSAFSMVLTALHSASLESRNYLSVVLNSVQHGVWGIDTEGKVTFINQAAIRLLGLKNEGEVIGKLMHSLGPHDSLNRMISHSIKDDLFSKRDGSKISVSHFSAPIFVGGECIGTVVSFEDRTNEKRMERAIETERMKVMQNSKLASLGEMSAGIAHEINNPLTIISGQAKLLANVVRESEKAMSKVDAIQKAAARIERIVTGLKKFSRSSEGSIRKVLPLTEIIREALVFAELRSKRFNVPVSFESFTDVAIHCDEVEIEQVAINLINNAIDAAKASATTSSEAVDRWVRIEVRDDSGAVVLRVTDSGVGIPVEIRERLFDPFFTTKDVGEGTGLGLSIAKGILDDHSASIRLIEDSPNTCFEVRFPRAAL